MTLSSRDWMHIRTELDELLSRDREHSRASATDQDVATVQPKDAQDSILKHIAEALRHDEEECA